MSDLDRRIDRHIAVLQWFRLMVLVWLAAFALWNAGQRHWWAALINGASIALNLWFARWLNRITQGSDNG